MNTIEKAGAIILKDKNKPTDILLLFREKHQDWTLPKGHIEQGESPSIAATREVKEETGLDIEIIEALPDLIYTLPKGDTAKVHMFLSEIRGTALLKLEHKGDRLMWYEIQEAINALTHRDMKSYLNSIISLITDIKI